MQCTTQNKLMAWNKSHHSSSLKPARDEEHRGNKACWERWRRIWENVCFSLQHSALFLFLPSWVTVPSITLWPLTCGGLASGPGQQVEASTEMTLGAGGGVSNPVRPGTSVTVRVTTTRAQSSIQEAVVAVWAGGGQKRAIKTDG